MVAVTFQSSAFSSIMANTKPIYDNVTISFRRICRWALWFSDISVLSSYAALPDQTMLANVERNVNPSQVAYDVPGICKYTN